MDESRRLRPPGLLRADLTPDVVMMLCTSGHVDHGKTRLVRMLTGCRTDRLKAEQERGLTIELGFAPCSIGESVAVGIVDVPGHERFVRTMVAGVSGISMTILVIAADDGIMPQTVEHLQIMGLLGVKGGLVALTKTDLVSGHVLENRIEEVRDFLRGTFLSDAPICPVSSKTFDGYSRLHDLLATCIHRVQRHPVTRVFRLPIERAFSLKGFGTVVTGIPVDGSIETGDRVAVMPGNRTGVVRRLQCFLKDTSIGSLGQCLAMNIPELDLNVLRRGQVVGIPGYLAESRILHVLMEVVPGLRTPLRNAEEIKFHTGTAEERGKIHLIEGKDLEPGQPRLATVVLAHPVVAAASDRFIIRRLSPSVTVGGGEILDISCSDRRPRTSEILGRLDRCRKARENIDPGEESGVSGTIEHFLRTDRPTGGSVEEISRGTLLLPEIVRDHLTDPVREKTVRMLGPNRFIHVDSYRACLNEIESRVRTASTQDGALVMAASDLHRGLDWPSELWSGIQNELERNGLVTVRGSKLTMGLAVLGAGPESRLLEELESLYERTGYRSPRPDELPGLLRTPPDQVDRVLEYLLSEGRLVRLSKRVVLSRDHFKRAQDLVVTILRKRGELDSADFKYALDSTRKYALAILDELDARNVTVRVGNERRLTSDYEKHLI